MSKAEKDLMTVKELAEFLGVGVQLIYDWRSQDKKIPGTVVVGGRLRYDRAKVEAALEKGSLFKD